MGSQTTFKNRDVLIIGTGPELKNHEKAVESFIKRTNHCFSNKYKQTK